MDVATIQTIIQGGILVTVVYIAAKTSTGGNDTGGKGDDDGTKGKK